MQAKDSIITIRLNAEEAANFRAMVEASGLSYGRFIAKKFKLSTKAKLL